MSHHRMGKAVSLIHFARNRADQRTLYTVEIFTVFVCLKDNKCVDVTKI